MSDLQGYIQKRRTQDSEFAEGFTEGYGNFKGRNETMNSYTVVIEPDEDAFHAYAPSLPGCHTFGDTVDEALAHIQEAIMLYLELLQEEGRPLPIEREPIFITRLAVPQVA
jgi:predicted RNase H-like HicB family nuclease